MDSVCSVELNSQNILFVCYGNICRSSFAERYMRLYYPEEKIRSAGVYPHSGRRPTPHAEEVAEEEFGIDLRDHRSTALADEHIEWADLIVVMDDRNYSNVKEKISEGKFLLFLDDKVVEDPFKKGKDAYSLVYNQIANAIKRWVNAG